MVDFLMISTRNTKRGVIEIYPKFIVKKSEDLMIRGRDFYAIWLEDKGMWSTEEQDALQLIDMELDNYAKENQKRFNMEVRVLHMWDSDSGMIDRWHKYCQKHMRDSFHMLDEKIIFSNMRPTKKDYASKRLNYPLEKGDLSAYDHLMSVIYSEDERQKIEWAIGSIVSGASKTLQKFMVLYGSAGTGKSTVLNIIQQLFDGYSSVFEAKALGSSNNSFALEPFRKNPLVAIQHDGDLSRIEDNTRLNSLVSHELMTVNEKFKAAYENRFKCFLFMGTNKPVKITDAKSGLIRRLIDVSPSGNKLGVRDYQKTMKQISFELGAIAYHCKEVYQENPGRYDNYIPIAMLGASNDFYNYVIDSYHVFKREDGTTLKAAWEMYKQYCDDAKVQYPMSQRAFKEELKNYFWEFSERFNLDDGSRVRSYYSGFRTDKFDTSNGDPSPDTDGVVLQFNSEKSLLDDICADYHAQYASEKGTPLQKWSEVCTVLRDLDTRKLHYVKLPKNHIVVDFDLQDEDGLKCFEKNLEAASKFPPTYAELSKSGHGIHLHYIYDGDPTELSRVYDTQIEVKVFTGNSSLRRKLTKCNDIPVATINSGLPKKEVSKIINFDAVKSEKKLRELVKKNLNKEIHAGTKPSIDFIYKILDDAYTQGLHYDISDMRNDVLAFAARSTHHASYCIKLVNKMLFKSFEPSESVATKDSGAFDDRIVFYDTEVFPNLFGVCWKFEGSDQGIKMINPTPKQIEELLQYRLVGFNCRRYDNHILYARLIGYTNEQLFNLSQKIVGAKKGANRDCFFREAYNISYTDVLDFSSKKQSLKKFEIDLGIHHQELGIPWDQPVPDECVEKVMSYCMNDVFATEATFHARKADFTARLILADIAGMTPNDTTNSLTARIIFDNDKNPQSQFNYRFMGDMSKCDHGIRFELESPVTLTDFAEGKTYNCFDAEGRPIFPGYTFENGISTYRGEKVGEGGHVHSAPGMYTDVALLDVESMHPTSTVTENLFGDKYTSRFNDILAARLAIKHGDLEKAGTMLDGKLKKYLADKETSADLAQALKIAINSVYGLTAANFENPFRDPRNVDNIVAKRGALFMINLKHAVQERGFTVAHIKTDSIKIPNATPEIIQFVMDYGKEYGYTFAHEATYERMCLVNDAVYIAKYATVEHCCDLYGEEYVNSSKEVLKDCKKHPGEWTATGTQFAVPYVFKMLFSKEPITFDDMCETKEVKSALYLDMNEGLPDVSLIEKKLQKIESDKKKGALPDEQYEELRKECLDEIAKGHNYRFVGKVGRFCPMKPRAGGGVLLRTQDGKYCAVTGTSGYRWMESEVVKSLQKEGAIDRTYYDKLVDDAVDAISKYGDYEWFVSE